MLLKQFYYLREIERQRSFSKAAQRCNVSQPALSRAIRQLEDELGVVIIDRKKKVFGLTEDGVHVLKRVHDILRSVAELRGDVSSRRSRLAGTIKIGVIPSAIHIVPVLREAVQSRMGDFACEVSVLPNGEIIERLASKQVDIGIMYHDQSPRARSFMVQSLYVEELVLAAAPAFSLPPGEEMECAVAASYPLALLSKNMCCRQAIDTGFRLAGVEPLIRFETDSLELIHAELRRGAMATILPISSFPLCVSQAGTIQMRRLTGFSSEAIGLVRLSEHPLTNFVSHVWTIASETDFRREFDRLG